MLMIDFPVPRFFKEEFQKLQNTFSVSFHDPVSAHRFALQIVVLGLVSIGHPSDAGVLITLDSGSEVRGRGFGAFFGIVSSVSSPSLTFHLPHSPFSHSRNTTTRPATTKKMRSETTPPSPLTLPHCLAHRFKFSLQHLLADFPSRISYVFSQSLFLSALPRFPFLYLSPGIMFLNLLSLKWQSQPLLSPPPHP